MNTAYLIYRPVMDYEESETPYLICLTKERAEEVRIEMVAFAERLLTRFKSLYDTEGDRLENTLWDEAQSKNTVLIEKAKWPHNIDLSSDLPRWDYCKGRDRFDSSCVAIRELPIV